ncbi:integrating conjugative element protein [Pseudomonas koreensis]|uniref:Integrating conjugative element protein n=1 Tax=Pseudomonas koreensis TaxID=198620 RepID=A0A9X2XDP8_9PSED|nr:integrating conjugative element protein [Pseudomonas koreensis]MCU7247284.1 integrating conjugative element protein [Pseudomonas koreensis]
MKLICAWLLIGGAVCCNPSLAETPAPRHADARFSEEDFLPVRSLALSPGPVQRRKLEAAGLPSFFLIGDDPLSRFWLKQRATWLAKRNVVGLVVNVQSKIALEGLRQIAPGLTLAPVSADDLAQRLSLKHYPVLITADRVEQ